MIGEYLDRIGVPSIKHTFPVQYKTLLRYITEQKLQLKVPKENAPSIPELVKALKITINQQRYFSEQRSMLKDYLKFFVKVQEFIEKTYPSDEAAISSKAVAPSKTRFSIFKSTATIPPKKGSSAIIHKY